MTGLSDGYDVTVRAFDKQDDDYAAALTRIMNETHRWIPARALKVGDQIKINGSFWSCFDECTPTEKTSMKPGPYKSTTHGNIPLSLKARDLLQKVRVATEAAIRRGEYIREVAFARGDLATYMSNSEARAQRAELRADGLRYSGDSNFQAYFGASDAQPTAPRPTASQLYKAAAEAAAREAEELGQRRHLSFAEVAAQETKRRARATQEQTRVHLAGADLVDLSPHYKILNDILKSKENPMNDKTNGEDGPAVEKTRSQLLNDATQELLVAQLELKYITDAPADAANKLSLCIGGAGILGEGIRKLVVEQFDAMRKKVTSRSKARVAKAEKAVSDLLT